MSHAEPQKIIPSHFVRRLLEAIRSFFFSYFLVGEERNSALRNLLHSLLRNITVMDVAGQVKISRDRLRIKTVKNPF